MSNRKNFAHDGKGAVAGEFESLPEKDSADALGKQAGIEFAGSETIATQEKLEQRDENRWELNADSAQPEL